MSKKYQKSQTVPLSVSQNFLTSSATIWRLLRKTSISKQDHVIEIGSGKGHITRALLKISKQVTAYELDPRLYQKLQSSMEHVENLHLMCLDFRTVHLPAQEPYKVFANIPFSITTDIIRKLTQAQNPPTDAWLIMEKGAAKRFMGQPRDNKTSLLIKPFFQIKIVDYLSPNEFHPAPSVDTVLLHLHLKAQWHR